MGWRTRRKAKRLPHLIERLQASRMKIEATLTELDLPDEQHEAGERLIPRFDQQIERGREFLEEYRVSGDIASPAFDEWYSVADGYATMGNLSLEELREAVRRV